MLRFSLCLILLEVYVLVICCSFTLLFSGEFLWALAFSLKVSQVSQGSKILGGTASRLRAMSWEVFSLSSFLVVHLRRISIRIYYLLSDGLTLVDVFPLHSEEEDRIKQK